MCQKSSIFQKKLGLKINEIRLSKNLSYQELAYRSEIEKANLIRIVNNTHNPTVKTLYKISKGLNIRVELILSFCKECESCDLT